MWRLSIPAFPAWGIEDKYKQVKRLIQGGSLPFGYRHYLRRETMKKVKRGERYRQQIQPHHYRGGYHQQIGQS